jgi:hypothetical protein
MIVYLKMGLFSVPKGSEMHNDFTELFLMGSGPRGYPKKTMFLFEYIQHHSTRIKKVSPANSWALKTY